MTVIPSVPTETTWLLSGQVEEDAPIRDVPISVTPFQVGRKSGVTLRIPSPTVSNVHAEFIERDGGLILRDFDSTNGTYVNGERITAERQVYEGDLIQFSNVVFRLKRHNDTIGVDTLQGESCDQAMALIQFDRLLNEGAIIALFQPIVRSSDLSVVAHEVLGRSPLFGLKTPDLMFQAAARLNLEAELSRMCRRVALESCRHWQTTPHLFLNTHPRELQNMDVLIMSMQEIRESFPAPGITLEIHEAAVTDAQRMRQLRAALKELHIQLAYDDFGSGQARLIELGEVPPDVLKFDIGFVRNVHLASGQRRRLLQNLVRMVREMGVQALAEGMETETEARTCIELGFDLHQGFYYGEPAATNVPGQ
jgi:EAL domain-containing protein (putative c-di-GMP-specific phosphodiesterase class I)